MGKFIDLSGQRFGRLTVIRRAENKRGRVAWLCRCDCGANTIASADKLRSGHTQSCGCIHKKQLTLRNTVHNGCGTRLYCIWAHIRSRCYKETCKDFPLYGGRGIRMCDEWEYDFDAFRRWALTNGYDDKLSIDRIDVNGNYCPENCRWANDTQQANNKRRNHAITFDGETHTLAEWETMTGIKQETIRARLKLGWTVEKTLTTPVKKES